MGKILRILLVIVLFIIFFEIGLFSSYTIVTAQVPDVKGLVDMQVTQITGFFSPQHVNQVLIKDPTPINFTNHKDVALKMEELSNVDGVNVDSMNATTYDDTKNDKMNLTIEALGYAAPNSTSGQIVISQDPSYKVIVSAVGSYRSGELVVDTSTIKVDSVLKLF
ncbi:MAG: hypothetical protein IJH63_05695 [Methanobrevibacter sp.]|uniref:Uncharacterized protein n=1 Tax=Methanobrevibacter millerae TaxID=230361 RepID=A0A8T3VCD4_9EURY|nr:hypothetical protein [Methanobrevibacter millerae]MBE6505397.1 hypothetical protein [Methanobrevibacter millerae]MBR0058136.1 hypothetical protein [Methanobrevibacter sp.]MBR0370199.1 hypothetical protein [Methanobrevibacter sp.]